MKYLFEFCLFILLLFLCKQSVGQSISKYIHIDQFGYQLNATKVAVLVNPKVGYNSNNSYTPSATIELRNAYTHETIYSDTPVIWNAGETHDQSGDKGWWFDFTSVITEGTYYIYDAINNEQSANFEISEEVYNNTLRAATKMFYYNRCNMDKVAPYAEDNWTDHNNFENKLQDANCRFVDDPTNVTLEKDLTGGWFDAGDYNKYVTFSSAPVHMLLSSYEENPEVYTDDWNIPESNNGLPDILDEVKYELDWLLKMCNDDGTTIIKMGSIDYAQNSAAPPSINKHQRYYGLTCSSAAINASSMFAHAAIIYDEQSGLTSFVERLELEAIAAWNYVLPLINNDKLETNCDDLTINSGDADRSIEEQKEDALIAAIYLFDRFGTSAYNDYIIAHIDDAEPLQGDYWGGVKIPLYDALLNYTTINGADSVTKDAIINSITSASNNNWNGFYGFSNNDLYRSFMPDWSYHWGSNLPKSGYALLNLLLIKYSINTTNNNDYKLKSAEQIHYFHGVNPQGLVYLTNMYDKGGDRCVNQIYHTWFNDGTDWDDTETSLYGPAPGFLVGGANQNYNANTSLLPPYAQPMQKSYLDFNTGYPDNSWELSEPAIYTQAYYVRLMANYASKGAPVAVERNKPIWGYQKGIHNLISWIDEFDGLSNQYDVQRSKNNSSWKTIKIIKNNIEKRTLEYLDDRPFKGINYYRIKYLKNNVNHSFSNTISINHILLDPIEIIPNPTSESFYLNLKSFDYHHGGKLKIHDIQGKVVYTLLIDRSQYINISNLTKGVYIVVYTDRHSNQFRKTLIKE